MAKRAVEGAVAGAVVGTAVPVAGTIAGGGVGGAGGAALGFVEGLFDVAHDVSGNVSLVRGSKMAVEEETRLKNEFIDELRAQKVDVIARAEQINAIWNAIKEKEQSAEFQAVLSDSVKTEQVVKACLARSILNCGMNNTQELTQVCDMNSMTSLEAFLSSRRGRTKEALCRFSYGVANSNDMKVILAASNGLRGDDLKPHEKALKSLVEDVVKPDIAAFMNRASKNDVLYQANLLGYGTKLHWERETVRDARDQAVAALYANEFGMSSVGLQDVRGIFDYYLHRHGAEELYDTKLKDGAMADRYPPKAVNALPEEEMDRYTRMVKQSMSHGRSTQPDVGDMFLRVCGYEYFMPQAVKTAGTQNIFSENPEAPAAYPMVNAVIHNFIEKLSLSPLEKYREQVGARLDNLLADSFIDFFARLGEIHAQQAPVLDHKARLRDSVRAEEYAPVFSSYIRRITGDATNRFDMFLDIYKHNLERTLETATDKQRVVLEKQIDQLSKPLPLLKPAIVKPDTHQARLLAASEDHLFENMAGRQASR